MNYYPAYSGGGGSIPTGTYEAIARGSNIDMGASAHYRYLDTTGVPNENTGTYTFPVGDTGNTVDLGETNTIRYVDAGNVYLAGQTAPIQYYMEATLMVKSQNRKGWAQVSNIILKLNNVQVANWSIPTQEDTKNTGEWVSKKGTKSGTYTPS